MNGIIQLLIAYSGYRNPRSEQHMEGPRALGKSEHEKFHPQVPQDIASMLEIAERGEIQFMWVVGTNPIVSLPDPRSFFAR